MLVNTEWKLIGSHWQRLTVGEVADILGADAECIDDDPTRVAYLWRDGVYALQNADGGFTIPDFRDEHVVSTLREAAVICERIYDDCG